MRHGKYLVVAGSLAEAIYVVAVWRLPWWRYGGGSWNWVRILGNGAGTLLACLALLLGLMAAYLLGWHHVRKGSGERPIIWGFALVFAATLLWLLPITSDLFGYLSKAHLFTDLGANPFVDAPLEFRDRLVLAFPAFHATKPSIYGPVWALLSSLGTLGPHDVAAGVFYLKGLAAAAYLGSVWLLERILRQVRPDDAGEVLYLFAWNPLILLMGVGDGHNDLVMMALILLAWWWLLQEKWVLAFGSLAFAVWIKYIGLILFPLFVLYAWRRLERRPGHAPWIALGGASLVFVLVSILVFVPFGGLEGIPRIGERLLQPANWGGAGANSASWALWLGLLLFAAAYVLLVGPVLRSRATFQELGNLGFVAFFLVFVFGAARSQPWHLMWPAALAGLADRRWVWPAIVGLSGVLLAVQIWVEWGAPGVGT